MQHCKLINCTFSGCTFEMSTTDSDIFEDCKFYNTNLATMHAENHKFVKCQFDNVCIGSSYFFGYSIANCSWNQVVFLYRGEHVDLNNILIDDVLEKFEVEHRYNDILNFYISGKNQEKIPDMLQKSFNYFSEASFGRMLDISLILESLSFAAIYETIDYEILYEALSIIEDIDISSYSFDERIEIDALRTKFQNALYLSPHSEEYLAKIDVNSISTLSIRLNNDNFDMCNKAAKNFLASISDESYWTLIEKQKGSWILIYSAATIIVLAALPKIIKNYADVYFDIKTKKVLSDKLLFKLQSTDISFKDIKKLVATTQEAELLLPAGQCINENLSKAMSDVAIAAITANM